MRLKILKQMQTKYKLKIGDFGPVKKFLAMRIGRRGDGSYCLDQEHYIDSMAEKFDVVLNLPKGTKVPKTPCEYGVKLTRDQLPETESDRRAALKLPYQALVGSLIYAVMTRPDIAYAVSNVARFMSEWGVAHYNAAVRILRYLYFTKSYKLPIAPKTDNLVVSCFVDANYGDDRDGGSEDYKENDDGKWKPQGGYVIMINGSPVSWKSHRMKCRVLSSMESEYVEASEAAKEVIWFRELMAELGHKQNEPTVVYEDNKSCISFALNATSHERTKHIDTRKYWLRDLVRDEKIELKHVVSNNQIADIFTKGQLNWLFENQRDKLFGLVPIETDGAYVCKVCTMFGGKNVIEKKQTYNVCSCMCCLSCWYLQVHNQTV
jgi:hypothetical protein